MQIGVGILAVWNDSAPDDAEGYENWYLGEHLIERLSIPGFRWGRRYRRLAGASGALPEYMTYYETDTAEVLVSPEYLARVNDPTPETHRIMSSVFKNMNRTICRRVSGSGAIRSTYTVAVVSQSGGLPALGDLPNAGPETLWREAWISAEPEELDVSEEESLRGRDAKITACALTDCASEQDALAHAAGIALPGVRASAYALTHSLNQSDLAIPRTNL